jgi:hypothetical protein
MKCAVQPAIGRNRRVFSDFPLDLGTRKRLNFCKMMVTNKKGFTHKLSGAIQVWSEDSSRLRGRDAQESEIYLPDWCVISISLSRWV